MLFNSWTFVFFFVAVYLAYLRLRHVAQNRLLFAAGLVFYGFWDYRFLALLMATTAVDFACGLAMGRSDSARHRRLLLLIAIATNLGSLGFFKYCDFFVESLVASARLFGLELPIAPLGILLPVGISFYTFQELSYVVDVYRRQIAPCRSFRDYAVYVTFFPQLVAGPIERASHLVRQVVEPRILTWQKIGDGLWLVVLGYFLKVVVADNAAVVADRSFNTSDGTGSDALIGIYAFALQIYCDFAGYSNIARGTASVMGFDIMVNFRQPYLATSPSDFWRRWHISLSTWLRDYLYIPLGGNRISRNRTYVNLMLTMLLGGLWHGASWKFVVWGLYQGGLLALFRLLPEPAARPSIWFTLLKPVKIAAMFQLTCYGWLIFRCNSLAQAAAFTRSLIVDFRWTERATHGATVLVCLAVPVLLLDLAAELSPAASGTSRWYRIGVTVLRVAAGLAMIALIYEIGVRQGAQFIYFQF
jgi:D-alanyl-lipoteichoic acid acyltransferase DltB (MBOAT superfamily)